MPEDAKLQDAVAEVVAALTGRTVSERETLISSGMIDSLSILRLIAMLEKKLGVIIPTESLQPDDFDSIALIVETVQRVSRPAG